MDATYTHTIRVKRGASYTFTVTRSGVSDATNWSAKIDFRALRSPASMLYHSIASPDDFVLTSADGKLVFTIRLSAEDTAAFTFDTAYFDLKLTAPNGDVEYPFDGVLYMLSQVTP